VTDSMGMPDLEAVKAYLVDARLDGWSDLAIASALASETVAQEKAISIPVDEAGDLAYSPDLGEALCARVARRLALRPLPLGFQATEEGTTFVGGLPAEIKRLEGPYRTWVCG
jgi:hypothetical protein